MAISDTRARKAQAAEKPYRIPDAEGLYLDVRPSGKKFWRVRYFVRGKESTYTPGQYPSMSLKEARQERDWAKIVASKGLHPKDVKREEEAARRSAEEDSFVKIANEWYEQREAHWTPYYASQIRKSIDREMTPAFGAKHITQVNAADVLKLIKEIEERGAASVAVLVRQWIGAIYRYAASTLRAQHDPAAPLRGAVEAPPRKHSTSLKSDQLASLARAIDEQGGWRITQLAMHVLMRTMVRTAELRGGRWAEIDFMRAEWRIPAERMKKRRPHVVPLSRQVIVYLQELYEITGHRDLMFPSYQDPRNPMNKTTINGALGRMGWKGKFSGHGFRSTASTLLNEHGWRGDLIERQLAHAPGDAVRAAYNHADYLGERQDMLQWWSDFIEALTRFEVAPPLLVRKPV